MQSQNYCKAKGVPNYKQNAKHYIEIMKKVLCYMACGLTLPFLLDRLSSRVSKEKEFRFKIKYFRLTIKKGFFTTTKIWEMREKPLTEEELESFFKSKNNQDSDEYQKKT